MSTQEQILSMLDLNESQYFDLMNEEGYNFLLLQFKCPRLADSAIKSKAFWRWWYVQWDRRNEELLHTYRGIDKTDKFILKQFQEDFYFIHEAKRLEIRLNSHLFEVEFDKLITSLHKERQHNKVIFKKQLK